MIFRKTKKNEKKNDRCTITNTLLLFTFLKIVKVMFYFILYFHYVNKKK